MAAGDATRRIENLVREIEPVLAELRGAAGTLGAMKEKMENVEKGLDSVSRKLDDGKYDVGISEAKAAAAEANRKADRLLGWVIGALGTAFVSVCGMAFTLMREAAR